MATVCGAYLRKSTDEGDRAADAKSVARQAQRAREFAKQKGWAFDERYVFSDDGVSGAEFKNRPGLNKLLEAVKGKHKLGALVVSEQSRLGRDTIRTLALLQGPNDSGVRVWSYLEDRELSLDTEMDEVQEFMKSWAGASERRKASQRVRDKMRMLAEQGRSTGGRLYGYETKGGARTVKPSEATVIKRIFKRRTEGTGYFKIARELEKDKILSPRGAKLWSPSQVGSILSNPTYNRKLPSPAGIPIAEILRQHSISKATYFHWRSKYAGASVDELKRLKELEAENTKLKRMYAELALENAAIKDVLSRKR